MSRSVFFNFLEYIFIFGVTPNLFDNHFHVRHNSIMANFYQPQSATWLATATLSRIESAHYDKG